MNAIERANACVLIVDPDRGVRSGMRQLLVSLDFPASSEVPNHLQALQKVQERKFTHVIFDAKSTNMPGTEFVTKLFELDDDIVAIPTSWEPTVDDVFSLLVLGANGFLVKPFTLDSLEEAILLATKGEPISESILFAKDRNEALVALEMTALDTLSTIQRQSLQFETARRELPRAIRNFQRTSEIARMFAKGGSDGILETLIEFCCQRAEGPASRLGRARGRILGRKRNRVKSIKQAAEEQLAAEKLREQGGTASPAEAAPSTSQVPGDLKK